MVRETVAPVLDGSAFAGGFCTVYVTEVSVGRVATTNCPSYPEAVIPLTRNAVSTSNPDIAESKVTVTVVVAVAPSPALILLIPTDAPVGPTILYSSILG